MDLQTLNEDEFSTLHPSIKKYLTAGIDTNKHGEKLVSEKNFFNMDLFNSDPYELDPNLSKRTEELRERPGKLGYLKQGQIKERIEVLKNIILCLVSLTFVIYLLATLLNLIQSS